MLKLYVQQVQFTVPQTNKIIELAPNIAKFIFQNYFPFSFSKIHSVHSNKFSRFFTNGIQPHYHGIRHRYV